MQSPEPAPMGHAQAHTRPRTRIQRAVHQEADLRPVLQQIRDLGLSACTAEERLIGARVTAAELRLNRRSTTPTGNDRFVAECNRDRGGRCVGKLMWRDPSTTTRGTAVRGLWGARFRPSQVCFRRLACSYGVFLGKRTGGLRQERRSVRDSHQ